MKNTRSIWRYVVFGLLALGVTAIITEYKGDDWEERIRKSLYAISNDSIPNFASTLIDEKGIPYVRYATLNGITAGDEYNPTIISNYAIDYFKLMSEQKDSSASLKFWNCINWLAANISFRDHYAIYEFDWQQPFYDSVGVPWTSGMTSGRAIEAFTNAYQLDHGQQWLGYASALLRGFYQPIQSGSFTYKQSTGWWYEEYADANMHTPRILDGHIYAILGVHKFWLQTKNDSAAYVVQQGILSLKNSLPGYDIGNGWSYYDANHKVSDKKYHMLNTALLKELWEMTKDPLFFEYFQKWEKPLTKPYLCRIIKERNRSGLLLFTLMSAVSFLLLFFVDHFLFKKK